MNNKLTFHIDSIKAFSSYENKKKAAAATKEKHEEDDNLITIDPRKLR